MWNGQSVLWGFVISPFSLTPLLTFLQTPGWGRLSSFFSQLQIFYVKFMVKAALEVNTVTTAIGDSSHIVQKLARKLASKVKNHIWRININYHN